MSVPAGSGAEHGQHLPTPGVRRPPLIRLPLTLALVALAGSLWLSIGMELKACPLCLYQRTFVMSIVAVLFAGAASGGRFGIGPVLMALPLATAGLGVAGFHEYLELTGALECPPGIWGIGTAPQQSLAAMVLLMVVLVAGIARYDHSHERSESALVAGVALGLLLAWAAVLSAPPMPKTPTTAYEQPLDMCRPPFRGEVSN